MYNNFHSVWPMVNGQWFMVNILPKAAVPSMLLVR